MILTDPDFLPYFIIDDSRWNNLLDISILKFRVLHFDMLWNLSFYLSLCHFMIVISTWMNLITLYAYLRSFFFCRLQFYFFLYHLLHHHLHLERILFPWSFVLFPPLFTFSFLSHSLIFSLPISTFRETCFTVDSLDGAESSKPYDTRQTTEHRTHNSMLLTSRHNVITRIWSSRNCISIRKFCR